MATLFVRVNVADYTAWRRIYDDFQETRKAMGVTSDGVYRLEGDNNDVTIYHEFPTTAAAEAFIGSSDLKDAMARGGVVGEPDIWITHRT